MTSPLATKVQGSWRGVAVLFVAMEAKEVAGCNGEAARVWFDVDLVVGRRFACWRLTLRAMVRLSARKEGAALTARARVAGYSVEDAVRHSRRAQRQLYAERINHKNQSYSEDIVKTVVTVRKLIPNLMCGVQLTEFSVLWACHERQTSCEWVS